jgi:hypothetical protein
MPGKMFGRELPSWIVFIWWIGEEGRERRPRTARWWREWPMERLRFEGSTKRAEIRESERVG